MIVVFVLALLIVPFLMGICIRRGIDFKGQNPLDTYLCGILALFVVSGVIQLLAISLGYSFSWYCRALTIAILILSVLGIISAGIFKNQTKEILHNARINLGPKAWKNKEAKVLTAVAVLLFLLCLVRNITTPPIVEEDFTLETIQTTFATDTIYRYNSLTGMENTAGMPIRQQILTLPFLLGFFIKTFGIDIGAVVFYIIPCYVCFLSFLVFHRLGETIYEKNYDKRATFMIVVGILFLVGDYAYRCPAYLLYYQGFSGYAIVACVVLPYLLNALMERKWLIAILCLATEVFLIWTTYGIGFGVVEMILFLGIQIVVKGIGKQKTKTCI